MHGLAFLSRIDFLGGTGVLTEAGVDSRQAFLPDVTRVVDVVLHIFGRVLPPLYYFDLVSLPVGLLLAATFFGLLAVSGVLAWRSPPFE